MINHSFKVGDINSNQLAYPKLTPDIWLFVVPRVETGIRHHWVVLEWKISHCFKRVRLIWTRCLEIIFVSPVQQLLNIQSYSVLPVFGACWQRTRPGAGNRMFNGNQKAKAREDEKPNRTNESEIKGLHYSRNCIKCALAWVLKTTPAAIPDQSRPPDYFSTVSILCYSHYRVITVNKLTRALLRLTCLHSFLGSH